MSGGYLPMWNRGPRAVKPVKFKKGEHRHDMLPGMCGDINGKFSHVFTAQNAFNVEDPISSLLRPFNAFIATTGYWKNLE